MAPAGPASMAPETVMTVFSKACARGGSNIALAVERGGKWNETSWTEFEVQVNLAARAFMTLGLKKMGCVNIIGFNSPEWIIADVAAIAAGGMAAGIYTTNAPSDCRYISEHSKAVCIVAEDEKQLNKFKTILDQVRAPLA